MCQPEIPTDAQPLLGANQIYAVVLSDDAGRQTMTLEVGSNSGHHIQHAIAEATGIPIEERSILTWDAVSVKDSEDEYQGPFLVLNERGCEKSAEEVAAEEAFRQMEVANDKFDPQDLEAHLAEFEAANKAFQESLESWNRQSLLRERNESPLLNPLDRGPGSSY